ncbi:hypothetical protein B0H14DRAFT_3728435 [Mycena olivaceomarginata]|nr:hypothetical protein B0H14DRAFT_3728435 [Mycena olivaceomarginata]
MDPLYFQDSLGNALTPIWSSKDLTRLCSVLAPPSNVAAKFLEYGDRAPRLLAASTPAAVLQDLDFTTEAVWYRSEEHWLGWIPTGEPPSSPYETDPTLDLLEICFDRGPVATVDNFYDAYDSDNQISPVERLAGCHLDPAWTQEAAYLGDRLHAISSSLAETSGFYCRGPPLNRVGDVPGPVDRGALELVFSNEEEAQEAATKAKRGLLSLLGFLSWMLSIVQLKDTKLAAGDQQYLLQLCLENRPKTGAVFNLSRDQHEINFPHWANNGVPFHYVWTEAEAKNKRFLRFSPKYYEEVARLREKSKGEDVSVEDLPSYDRWRDNLAGSNWIGQNLRAGKMGTVEDRFSPSMTYGIVDRHLYGCRPLMHWATIRVYAEHFKALIRERERETVCTFFRNNPIHKDEPAYSRQPLRHRFALSDFAPEERGDPVSEELRHYESNTVVREQVKNLYAPRPDRPFNSFNGGPALSIPGGSLQHGSHLAAPPVLTSVVTPCAQRQRPAVAAGPSWRFKGAGPRAVAGLRRRSSRSLSPPRRGDKRTARHARSLSSGRGAESGAEDEWFQEEFRSAAGSHDGNVSDVEMEAETFKPRRDDSPFDATLNSVVAWTPKYRSEKEAVDAIAAWAPSVLEYDPKKEAYDPLSWNTDWLDKAYLVFDDPRTIARLKALCALFPSELNGIQPVLEYAMRFGMPFELCIKMQDAGEFRNYQLSSLAMNTLPAVYNMGYADSLMTWAGTSDAAQFGIYLGTIFQLLQKPNAIAFIAKGGVCKFVAELFVPDLAYRFVCGPSEQVSEFGKGRTPRLTIDGRSTLCISDQVTDQEIAILLGHVKGKNSDQERSLWPLQALLEQYSLHFWGYLSTGAYSVLDYLKNRILVEKIYDWKTKVEWKAYLRGGAKGLHAPSVVPSKADFEEGWRILNDSFPVDWQHASAPKLVLPERFDPHARRN